MVKEEEKLQKLLELTQWRIAYQYLLFREHLPVFTFLQKVTGSYPGSPILPGVTWRA